MASARDLIRNATHALVRESAGAGPLASLAAARSLEWAAREAGRTHARAAREDGSTWEQIGSALGYRPGENMPPVSESAFRAVASDLGSGPVFPWECPACREIVRDYGPDAGSPEDQEQGHAEGCVRLADTVARWEEEWSDE